MAASVSFPNVNHALSHRDVRFAVVRVTRPDEPPAFCWTVYPEPGPAHGADTDTVVGPKAFTRAHAAACAAIDAWLAAHPPA